MQECFKNIKWRDVYKKICLLEFYVFGNVTVLVYGELFSCHVNVLWHWGKLWQAKMKGKVIISILGMKVHCWAYSFGTFKLLWIKTNLVYTTSLESFPLIDRVLVSFYVTSIPLLEWMKHIQSTPFRLYGQPKSSTKHNNLLATDGPVLIPGLLNYYSVPITITITSYI